MSGRRCAIGRCRGLVELAESRRRDADLGAVHGLYLPAPRAGRAISRVNSGSGVIEREDLVNATREQWQAQGILAREAQSQAWLRMLAELWPDVEPGTQLAFVLNDKQGQFWYRASAAQTRFMPLGPRQSADFSQNFLAIWLDPRTQYPELRQQLTGGQK